MEQIYQILFRVNIWHDYFIHAEDIVQAAELPSSYDIRTQFEIVPTAETEYQLQKHHCLFRTTPLGLIVIAEVKEIPGTEDFETIIPFNEDLRLSFVIRLKDSHFFNYTNLPFPETQQLYYTSNLERTEMATVVNGTETYLYLCEPMRICDGDCDYDTFKVGDIISDPSGNLFEVLDLPIMEDPDPDLNNQSEWAQVNKTTHYLTRHDALDLVGDSWSFVGESPLGPNPDPNDFEPFEVYDIYGERIPLGYQNFLVDGERVPYELPIFPKEENELLQHILPLERIPAGRYTVSFFGSTVGEFYRVPGRQLPQTLTAVDIFHLIDQNQIAVPEAYQFIETVTTGNNERQYIIRPKTYHLHFKNRTTRWQYCSAQTEDLLHEESRPRELTKRFIDLNITLPNETEARLLPNPAVTSLVVERVEIDGPGSNSPLKEVYTSKTFI